MASPPANRDLPPNAPDPRVRPTLTVSSGVVSATFTWTTDRWRHSLCIDGREFAESVEDRGDGRDSAWPASPPLVELSQLELAHGQAVLGVGLAGRSHFSASVAPHPSEPDTLVFEMACRIKDAPGWLGSTYVVGGRPLRITAPDGCDDLPATIRWSYSVGRGGIMPISPASLGGAR